MTPNLAKALRIYSMGSDDFCARMASDSCRAIESRAKNDVATAQDLATLRDADSAARILSRAGEHIATELRAATNAAVAALEARDGGPIKSRLDSHHWDKGFLEVESGFEVVSVIDGDVLCQVEDDEVELRLIDREEVRVHFGGGIPD